MWARRGPDGSKIPLESNLQRNTRNHRRPAQMLPLLPLATCGKPSCAQAGRQRKQSKAERLKAQWIKRNKQANKMTQRSNPNTHEPQHKLTSKGAAQGRAQRRAG